MTPTCWGLQTSMAWTGLALKQHGAEMAYMSVHGHRLAGPLIKMRSDELDEEGGDNEVSRLGHYDDYHYGLLLLLLLLLKCAPTSWMKRAAMMKFLVFVIIIIIIMELFLS